MKSCYLHLGSNIGNRRAYLEKAMNQIEIQIGRIEKKSCFYETEAWGKTNQDSFYNIAIKLKTKVSAFELLKITQRIEKSIGRIKTEHWGPREIDIDIIFYGYDIIDTEELCIPHPLMSNRKFVLLPLLEITGGYVHSVLNKKIASLLNLCTDTSEVKKLNE